MTAARLLIHKSYDVNCQELGLTDIVDKVTRSRMMSRIRGRDTKPELALRKSLHARGFRYRLHAGSLPGRPDIVFPKHKAVVFVHGCFWHRHSACRFSSTPSSNEAFWREKFSATVKRDARRLAELKDLGWRVAIVWECCLGARRLEATTAKLGKWLLSERNRIEMS